MKKNYLKTSFTHDLYGKIDVDCILNRDTNDYTIIYNINNKNINKLIIYSSGDIDMFMKMDKIKRYILDQYCEFIDRKYYEKSIINRLACSIMIWKIGEYREYGMDLKLDNVIRVDDRFNLENVYMTCNYNDGESNIFSPVTYNVRSRKVKDVFFEGYN